jgi:hypothetical protein
MWMVDACWLWHSGYRPRAYTLVVAEIGCRIESGLVPHAFLLPSGHQLASCVSSSFDPPAQRCAIAAPLATALSHCVHMGHHSAGGIAADEVGDRC